MKISGIVVEYNPLHNGHTYHINKTKELTNCDGLIAIMSGNFNQRGIPSVIDKWNKTSMALNSGVDLVLELPVIYSLSSAEFFSFGAISLLHNLGVVDSICFGSELGDISTLLTISKVLIEEPLEFKNELKSFLDLGIPFPKARSLALLDYLNLNNLSTTNHIDHILSSSNNILGMEYIKSLTKLNSSIVPYTIKREGASYNSNSLNNVFSSATAIRNFLKASVTLKDLTNHVPEGVFTILNELRSKNYNFTFDYMMFPYIKYLNSISSSDSLSNIPDANEGLYNKIRKNLFLYSNYDDVIAATKSKRYTYTRISRILCQYFVGFHNYNTLELRKSPCSYARVLGFNSTGIKILKSMKANSNIPIYTKFPKELNESLALDLKSTQAYSIINPSINYNDDYLISPINKM